MTLVLTPTCSEPTINQQTTLTVEQIDRDRSTPQMEDFNITREKRRQLRRLLINSQPLISDDTARESRSDGSPLSNDERKTYHADLDEAVRWNLFLTHTDLNLPEVVDFVSYVHNVNEDEHQCALAKAVECHESFKKTTLSNIRDHATAKVDWDLYGLDDAAMTQRIGDSFSHDKFFATFAFMQDYLDFGGSSSLGKWYAKGIYMNMTCAAV